MCGKASEILILQKKKKKKDNQSEITAKIVVVTIVVDISYSLVKALPQDTELQICRKFAEISNTQRWLFQL